MEVIELGERAAVEQFHNGRLDPCLADGQDAGCGAAEIRVERGNGVDLARQVPEPDGNPDHDPQRALGADEQPGQVVAGDPFEGLVAGMDEGPVREHDVERQDGVPGDAVLGAAQPAGVGGDVAADRGDPEAGRIRGVHQPVHGRGGVEVRVDDPGFDDGGLVLRVQVQDAVHPFQAQHDAALGGVGPAGDPGTGAPGHHGHAAGGARADRGLHVFD